MDKKLKIMNKYVKHDLGGCPVYNEQSVIGMLDDLDCLNLGVYLVKENERLEAIVIGQSNCIIELQGKINLLQEANDILMGIERNRVGVNY